jgi:thioesterase domain-containing protein
VKVRGYRIELGEIEAALERNRNVEQAVVIARDTQFGDKQLVAYVVMPAESSVADLRADVKEQLPSYMVPAHIVKLDSLPLTANGKIDRKALPAPDAETIMRSETYVVPETPTEKELAKIWSELLGLEQVGIHDDFFEVGGHSLLAIRMRSMIQDRLKRSLSLPDLFRAPTIASLAHLLDGPKELSLSSILVEIQPLGSRAPFFAVHPAGGNVLCYSDLARELGTGQPFYALQAPALSELDSAASLEEIAQKYVEVVRSAQPCGPYLLGGWSFGGLVAWEMARQLAAEGETIGFLVLIDTYPVVQPSRGQAAEPSEVLPWFAQDMARLLGIEPATQGAPFEQLRPEEQWAIVQNELVAHQVISYQNAQEEMTQLIEIFARNFHAMERYSLRQSEQSILLLAAAEGQPEKLFSQWRRWARGGVEFQEVPGDHYTMMQRPNVEKIADALQRRLHEFSNQVAGVAANTELS